MLTSEEELGLKIIVLLRKKYLGDFKCSDCNEHMRAKRNHNGNADHSVPVLVSKELDAVLYTCPIILIPSSIYSFLDQYDYYEKYPAAVPSYEDVNPRFWEAVKFYENYMSEIESDSNSKSNKSSSEDNLSKMKNLIMK